MRKLIIVLLVLCVFYSCQGGFSCDESAANFRDGYECNLLLQKIDVNAGLTTFYGADLKSHQQTTFEDGSKWIRDNLERFAIGDSVIKKKGEYTIKIKRKGKTILIPFKCDLKTYSDAAYNFSDYMAKTDSIGSVKYYISK